MFKRAAAAIVVFLGVGLLVWAAGFASGHAATIEPIAAESACPATGCASGACHGYGDVPEPDGIHELVCPEENCASTECHAWESITNGHYGRANDASLNLWILLPVLLAGGLVALLRRL